MAIIPEILLQRAIVQGYRQLRQDPRLLDALFKNLPQTQQQAVRDFILNVPINFAINYPRNDLKVPSLILMLKNESENVPFLGDSMHTVDGAQEHLIDTLGGHSGSISTTSGLTTKIGDTLEVLESDDTSVTFVPETDLIELLSTPQGNLLAIVVSGTGQGQVFPVSRIRKEGLDIVGTFDPYLDTTSRIDLRRMNDVSAPVLGEPSRVFDAGNLRNLRQRGAEYEVTYHLHVIASGQDEVIYLYSVVKALLMSQRSLLEGQGIIALRISGSDFAPRNEYLPSEIFQRMMVLTFTYPFSYVEELDLPDKFVLTISPGNADTQEYCGTLVGTTIEL